MAAAYRVAILGLTRPVTRRSAALTTVSYSVPSIAAAFSTDWMRRATRVTALRI